MRKFKHKQSGQIVTENKEGLFVSQHGGYKLRKWIFENSNDWEEVHYNVIGNMDVKEDVRKEPNYLITAFSHKRSRKIIYKINNEGQFNEDDFPEIKINKSFFDSRSFEIYSAKNSIGEEFTIGDNVFYLPKRTIELFKIDNFFINRDGILLARSSQELSATCEDINTIAKEIKVAYKSKESIYTTTDGTEIFEGDKVSLFIYTNNGNKFEAHIPSFDKSEAITANKHKCFISEENRDKYIKENTPKPFFKTEDGVDIYEKTVIYIVSLEEHLIFPETFYFNKTMTGDAIFFDEKMALKYLNENIKKKPVFTSADGKEYFNNIFYDLYCISITGSWEEKTFSNIVFDGSSRFIVGEDWLAFSTEEARQEYIDNNKPKYSLDEITFACLNAVIYGKGIGQDVINELKKLGK